METKNVYYSVEWWGETSCGQRWKYTERFTLDTTWIETEEED